MDAGRRGLAAEIHAAATEHDAALEDRLARFRIVEPETAELLAIMAAEPAVTSPQVPIGAGLQLAVKR